jgi:ABC-2 type transport system ATP-binding protein
MNDPVVQLNEVDFAFDGESVLQQLSLALQPGSIMGLLGRNGAGKTTLMRVALGLLQPDRGTATLWNTTAWDAPLEIRRRVGYVPQTFDNFQSLRVKDCLDLVGSFYDAWDTALIDTQRETWKINPRAIIGTLSKGQQQMVSILLAIGHRPALLVLDEPVASLDPAARRDFLSTLVRLNSDLQQTILFSTHITADLERIASDVAVLHRGRIALQAGLDELKEGFRRLQIRSETPLPHTLACPKLLRYERDGGRGQALVRDWTDDDTAALETALSATLHTQPLDLETVFLELTA